MSQSIHEVVATGNARELAGDAAAELLERLGIDSCDAMVVLGSGWAGAAEDLGEAEGEVDSSSLPGFAAPTAVGHSPAVRSMWVGAKRVLVFMGRVHLFDGHGPAAAVHAVRTGISAGARSVLLTNAAGTLRSDYAVGQPILIRDHINLTACLPLDGADFLDMEQAYSPRLQDAAHDVAPSLTAGVYAGIRGPSLPTGAEVRMLRTLGADLVGMSTVLETAAAVEMQAEVLGLSLVTHVAAGQAGPRVTGQAVREVGAQRSEELANLLHRILLRV